MENKGLEKTQNECHFLSSVLSQINKKTVEQHRQIRRFEKVLTAKQKEDMISEYSKTLKLRDLVLEQLVEKQLSSFLNRNIEIASVKN